MRNVKLSLVYVVVNIQDIKGKPSLTLSRSVLRCQLKAETDFSQRWLRGEGFRKSDPLEDSLLHDYLASASKSQLSR